MSPAAVVIGTLRLMCLKSLGFVSNHASDLRQKALLQAV